jgi:hypothetical protein
MSNLRRIVPLCDPTRKRNSVGPRSAARRLVACLALTLATGCSSDKGPKPSRVERVTTTLTATVKAIDHDTRTLTLEGPAGGLVTLKADESVKNLSRLHVGDRVRAVYHESLAMRVRKPGDPSDENALAADSAAGAAAKGVPVAARHQTITATVEAVDRKRSTVTLKGPAGGLQTLRVPDARRLENVNAGDEVDITYSESLAVSLEKVGEGGT